MLVSIMVLIVVTVCMYPFGCWIDDLACKKWMELRKEYPELTDEELYYKMPFWLRP